MLALQHGLLQERTLVKKTGLKIKKSLSVLVNLSGINFQTVLELLTLLQIGGRFDEVHVVVIDDKGTITGNAGTILEKHLALSKAKDAEFSVGSPSYWRKYLYTNSEYIFGGSAPVGVTTIAHSDNGRSDLELDD